MRLQRSRFLPVAFVALLGLSLVPGAAATTPPVAGTVTNCASTTTCDFVFNTTAGSGWAATTSTTFSFQLPGESSASYNLSYSTYIGSLKGTYTYWTVGNFVGTDANTGYVVYGTTDTNYTITCIGHSGRGGGCTYVYTTDNGTVVVDLTKAQMTQTTVSCSPTSVRPGVRSTCSVAIVDLWNSSAIPTGKVHLSAGGLGAFGNKGTCTLSAGKCSLGFRAFDNTLGTVTISATYAGTASFYTSAGTTSITVT